MPGVNQTFSFNTNPAAVYPLVTEIVGFVQVHENVPDDCVVNLKAVLVELLTNAIKHSGGSAADIEVAVADNEVIITKRDKGEPLSIITDGVKLNWPLPGNHQGGREINLYGDGTITLKCRLANNCTVSFYVEEFHGDDIGFEPQHLPEHFGMMIIARACYRFTYAFDIETCTNVFTAALRLQ